MAHQPNRRSFWARLMSPVPIRMLSTGTALVLLTFSATSYILFSRLAQLAGALPADGFDEPLAALVGSLLRIRILMPLIFIALAIFVLLVESGRKKQVRDETRVLCAQLRTVGQAGYRKRPLRKDDELIPVMNEVDRLAARLAVGVTEEVAAAPLIERESWPELEKTGA